MPEGEKKLKLDSGKQRKRGECEVRWYRQGPVRSGNKRRKRFRVYSKSNEKSQKVLSHLPPFSDLL